MKNLKLLSTLLFSIFIFSVSAQFVTPVEMRLSHALVTNTDGEVLQGKIKASTGDKYGVMKIKFDQTYGDKVKLYASSMKEIKQEPGKWVNYEILVNKTKDKKKRSHANYEEVVKTDYVIWEQVELPSGEGFVMMQLLNPGFDNKMKVYFKPTMDQGQMSIGNVTISDGKSTEYLVLKNGITYDVDKKFYKKGGYVELFGDCEYMKQLQPDFQDFAREVFIYDQICD